MESELESYLGSLGAVLTALQATDRAGDPMSLAQAQGWAIDRMLAVKASGGKVMFVGNGGSAAISSHMATDYMKNGGFPALAFNDGSALTCLSNDLGYERVFSTQVEMLGRLGDMLIAISSSGNSQNILNAVTAARDRGVDVLTLTGFQAGNKLRAMGDVNIYLPSDLYGFVEAGHLAILGAVLDIAMGWQSDGTKPAYAHG